MESTQAYDEMLAQLMAAVADVPGATVLQVASDLAAVSVGGDCPTVALPLADVVGVERLTSPDGQPAVRVAVLDPARVDAVVPLLLVAGDVAFAPDPVGARRLLLAHVGPAVTVADMPPMLGWREVLGTLARWDEGTNLDERLARALLAVAGVEGARRVGVDVSSVEKDVAAVVDAMAAW